MTLLLAAVRELVSSVRKDGKPVVRLSCADYGTEWVVAADVYPVDLGREVASSRPALLPAH